MKKLLVVSIMALGLGTVAMAQGNKENKMSNSGKNQNKNNKMMESHKMMGGDCFSNEERAQMREKMRTNPKIKEGKIKLQENKVELMKEMNKENPDFNKIEKINKNSADIQAEMKTEQMKMNYEILKANKNKN